MSNEWGMGNELAHHRGNELLLTCDNFFRASVSNSGATRTRMATAMVWISSTEPRLAYYQTIYLEYMLNLKLVC